MTGSMTSDRYCSCSSPPWAEIVNARTRGTRGYIFGRILCRHVTASNRRSTLGDHCIMTAIQVPALGESIVEGTIARWLKNEGDAVQKGDALVELETDKINVEVPAPASGVLVKRLKNDGDVVKVGETLGELDEAAVPATAGASAQNAPAAAKSEAAPTSGAPSATPAAPGGGAAEPKTSPSVRRVAAETGVDPAQVPGTGRD